MRYPEVVKRDEVIIITRIAAAIWPANITTYSRMPFRLLWQTGVNRKISQRDVSLCSRVELAAYGTHNLFRHMRWD